MSGWEIGWVELNNVGEAVFYPLECDCRSTGGCERCRPRPITLTAATIRSILAAERKAKEEK